MIGQLNLRRKLERLVLSLLFITITMMLSSCGDNDCSPPTSSPAQVSVKDNGDGTCVTREELTCTCAGSNGTGSCVATYNGKLKSSVDAGTTLPTSSACPSQVNCVDLGIVCQ
ncbi:hypothetical protein BN59_00615 [Legionella massiliensis]|uniref:Uncharacterized protein n=1 Tax=Legionella massiliensis TaxID=1034943 RepID=A0A078KTQ5_9GAMM|nr:hypothetical protein BN59_00615 [Legionella massiliensis]CEE12085.1 hypothetical protein BN1094_00615 [Legionella massiliensis]